MHRNLSAVALLIVTFAAHGQQPAEELDTPFVTTPPNVVRVMLEMADVTPGVRLMDLGSGDGRVVIAAAQLGAQAVGVEIDPALVDRSRVAAQRAGVAERATFVVQDLFQVDMSGADVVTLYLLPDVNARLRPKLFATLHPGARIVSHDYDLGEWVPDTTVEVAAPEKRYDGRKTSRVHYWLVPARIAGTWEGTAGGNTVRLDVLQRYQRVSGTVTWRGREYRFAEQPITGRRLVLRLARDRASPLELMLIATGEELIGRFDEGPLQGPILLRR